jgi:hypothetical protein
MPADMVVAARKQPEGNKGWSERGSVAVGTKGSTPTGEEEGDLGNGDTLLKSPILTNRACIFDFRPR